MFKQLKAEKMPVFLASLERLLKSQGGKHFAGSSLTWADIVVYHALTLKMPGINIAQFDETTWRTAPPCVTSGSLSNIKKWEQTRPVTPR